MTLREHAIAWAIENHIPIPPLDSPQWKAIYSLWVAYAFDPICKQ